MRKLKVMEHISLDGVIQVSGDDGDFPYGDWTAPYRTPEGRAVRSAPESTPPRSMSLPTVRIVLLGARSKPLDRTSSRAFAASSRRTARTLSSRVAPR